MFSNPEKILMQFGLAKSLKVADFGAGAGYYVMLLSGILGKEGKVYAIDVNKDLLVRIANTADKEGKSNIEIVRGNVEKERDTTIKDSTIDAVVIANTLFSMDDKLGAAKEAERILKKKGRVLVVEWADSFAGMGPHRDHVVNEAAAKKIFLDAGFSFERNIDAGAHHYGLVFRK